MNYAKNMVLLVLMEKKESIRIEENIEQLIKNKVGNTSYILPLSIVNGVAEVRMSL